MLVPDDPFALIVDRLARRERIVFGNSFLKGTKTLPNFHATNLFEVVVVLHCEGQEAKKIGFVQPHRLILELEPQNELGACFETGEDSIAFG